MNDLEILLIAGTRPNFIKIAPLFHSFKDVPAYKVKLCHTGQHYDRNMSASFWECLELPDPDFDLKISGGNVPDTIGKTIIGINDLIQKNHFDLVIVVGDVNATVAGAIAASQNGIKVMHVESGLRSFDRRMPEEINRVVTDHVSDFLMVSEPSGLDNLSREGISFEKVHMVGNIMIESLIRSRAKWSTINLGNQFNINPGNYVVGTFHRPENVDDRKNLTRLVDIIDHISKDQKIIFPVHPRTKNRIAEFRLDHILKNENIISVDPLGYFEFLKLVSESKFVITDSGGLQEETTYLNIPCITIRNNTERPITLTRGTNKLIRLNDDQATLEISRHLKKIQKRKNVQIALWDDKVSQRIIKVINESFKK
jgi:UDP-N-acetylglucosamine 2-epimerase (non-hydrolysing)